MEISDTFNKKQQNLEMQRETFVASLGHDLKNPTIAQIRALELFLKGRFGKLKPEQEEVLGMILDSCRYMLAMLGSLLETYRYDKGCIKLDNEQVSITNLASETMGEMIYLAKDKEIQVLLQNQTEKEYVWGDKVQLKRVIVNLLTNGIKYAYRKTKLLIRIYNLPNYTCFEFENESPYINEKKRAKIFERYITFSKSDRQFNIGLGLYASKKIVEAHNGEMFVKSFTDNKNIFGFKIPNDDKYQYKKRKVIF